MEEKNNKIALITGIGSGIGLSMAKKLLAEGYKVIGTTRRGTIDKFSHPNLIIFSLDLNSDQSRTEFSEKIVNRFKIQLLVNNAGIAPDVLQIKPSLLNFKETIETNLTGTIFLTEAMLDAVADNGQIIFISSEMGISSNAGETGTAYRTSKAAINMYAAILAKRLENRSITVAPVHPGWVKTKLGGNLAPLTPEESAARIYDSLNKLETGEFYNTNQYEVDH